MTVAIFAGGAGGAFGPQNALSFDGSGDWLSISDANFGTFDRAQFAIAFSIKPDTVSGLKTIYAQKNSSTGARSFSISTNGSELEIYFSDDGTSDTSEFRQSSAISAGTYQAFLIYYDSANGTAGDRIRVWKNNSEITSPTSYVAPTAPVFDSSLDITIGATANGALFQQGLIFSPTFFSGSLPAPGDVFDGTSGRLRSLQNLTGAKSLLDGDTAVSDAILASDWTANGDVTTSPDIP